MKFHVLFAKMKRLSNIEIKRVKTLELWTKKKLLNIEKTFLLRNTKNYLNPIQYIPPPVASRCYTCKFYDLFSWLSMKLSKLLSIKRKKTRYSFQPVVQRNIFQINIWQNGGRNIRYCAKLRIIHVQTI